MSGTVYDIVRRIGGIHMLNTLLLIALGLLTALFILQMRRSLKRSTLVNLLINEYIDHLDDPALIDTIYAYCTSDWRLRRIMKRYGGTRTDIEELFQKLLIWANFRKGRRFVPISAFFFAGSLAYLLRNKDAEPKKLAMKMMNFFHI
jgi:hypothetical protein